MNFKTFESNAKLLLYVDTESQNKSITTIFRGSKNTKTNNTTKIKVKFGNILWFINNYVRKILLTY